ncbi:MAG TPA: hypothetical protein VF832_05230 [Longimicrobiales bacterium]
MTKQATPAAAAETAAAGVVPAQAPALAADAGRDRLPVRACQHKLLILWCVMSALALVVVMIQTASGGVYASHASEVFDWLLPTLVPTLSLMVGTVVADARAADSGASVDAFTYRFVFWVSVAYLLLVMLALLMNAQSPDPVGALRTLGKIVSGLYTVVGISLGAFFVTRKSGA